MSERSHFYCVLYFSFVQSVVCSPQKITLRFDVVLHENHFPLKRVLCLQQQLILQSWIECPMFQGQLHCGNDGIKGTPCHGGGNESEVL